ncbi:hypothetical protein V5799_032062 [Amblyomma americanum]|uniref:M13 family peptidase n=1 Tax=Amblyomma americanum TaxID=6943 RepID=A0AAQ4DS89_AMBAM
MNTKSNPCTNFYSFVCGSWTPVGDESSMIERMYAKMRSIAIQELEGDPKQAPVPLAPLYFRSCMAAIPDNLVQSEIEKFKRFKRGLGLTWPEEWPESIHINEPPLKILINLSVNWNIHLIFRLRAMPGYHGRPKALYISNGDWNPTWENTTEEQFGAVVKQHCDYLGVPKPGDHKELMKYMQKITNATVAFPADASYEDRKTIKDINHDDMLTQHLNDIYSPQFSWKQEDVVIIQHPDLLMRLEHLLTTVPEAPLRMGLSWVIIHLYLWKVIGKPELWAKGDADALQTMTKQTCLTHLETTFGLAVSAKRIRERFNRTLRDAVNSFFDTLRGQIESKITGATWIDDVVKKKSIAKLEDIWRDVLPDDRFFSFYSLAALYKNFPAVGNSFMDNFIGMAKALRKTMDKDDFITVFSKELGSGSVASRYSYYYNSVSMDVGALEPPLVYEDGTLAMSFGSLGTILASSLVRAFDPQGVLYNEKGEEEPWWSEGREELDKRFKCNLGAASSAASSRKESPTGAYADPYLFSLTVAVRVSYEAYRAAIYSLNFGESTVMYLQGLAFSDVQMFFMTFCLMTCATDSNGDYCNVPMRHSSKFAAAFHCNPGTEMNPVDKCTLF